MGRAHLLERLGLSLQRRDLLLGHGQRGVRIRDSLPGLLHRLRVVRQRGHLRKQPCCWLKKLYDTGAHEWVENPTLLSAEQSMSADVLDRVEHAAFLSQRMLSTVKRDHGSYSFVDSMLKPGPSQHC